MGGEKSVYIEKIMQVRRGIKQESLDSPNSFSFRVERLAQENRFWRIRGYNTPGILALWTWGLGRYIYK